MPPLGLITISPLIPSPWGKKLVDLNTSPLLNSDLDWADYAFISAMIIQRESVDEIVRRCENFPLKIVAGGPLFIHEYNNFPGIDHFILNEAELTLPGFINDLENGIKPNRIYKTDAFADISHSPVPDFQLLEMTAYASMSLQFSRGCPFSCDFCEVTTLLGHKVRMKSASQIIRELDALYDLNWRGSISIVDDNFIGNRKELKQIILPALIHWMQQHYYPFIFNIQTTLEVADDHELLEMMRESGIYATFLGIESLSLQSLKECNKAINWTRNPLQRVRDIQRAGIQVSAGFIVGFDHDPPAVFEQQSEFIRESGIVWAMVSLLNAPKNTKLYTRLAKENRIISGVTGNNTDYSLNFVPRMNPERLLHGYRSILRNTYSVKPYYRRIRTQLTHLKGIPKGIMKIDRYYIRAFFRSMLVLGVKERESFEYWRLLTWTLFFRPRFFLFTIMYTLTGYHFRKVYGISD